MQKRDIITKLTRLMRKTNLLDVISMSCTLLFLICSSYIFQQLIYFLIIDAVVCSVCVIGMFQFGNQLYLATCYRCESICICLYCLENGLKRITINTIGYQTFENDIDMVKTSVSLKETTSINRQQQQDTTVISSRIDTDGALLFDYRNTSTYITRFSHDNVEPKELETT
eukprot:412164_1